MARGISDRGDYGCFIVVGIGYSGYLVRVKHVVYVLASICAFGIVIALPLKIWELGHKTCLFAALFLASVVLIPGIGTVVNGSRRWIDFGFFTVQASESVSYTHLTLPTNREV